MRRVGSLLGPCKRSVLGRGSGWGDRGGLRDGPRSWAEGFGLERSRNERGIGPYRVGWRTPVASATKRAVREAVAGGASCSRQAKGGPGEGEGRRAWRLGPVGTCRALPGTRTHPPPSVRASPGPPVTLQTGRPRGSSGWAGDPWLSNCCGRVWVRLAQAAKRAGGGVPPRRSLSAGR